MITCWTITDFALQWLWVVLILICAVIFIWRRMHLNLRNKNNSASGCDGCFIAPECHKQDDTPDKCSTPASTCSDADIPGPQCGDI